ncbi:hypothetical protein Sjap_018325 [Stephania japonica]|uniref:Uncharacterized protein n=1 Tax=Stephania japonica TaxID=461633 RepID=A0AAP0I7X0_9MAGN
MGYKCEVGFTPKCQGKIECPLYTYEPSFSFLSSRCGTIPTSPTLLSCYFFDMKEKTCPKRDLNPRPLS